MAFRFAINDYGPTSGEINVAVAILGNQANSIVQDGIDI
jgi:hypothetical protein